MTDEDGLICSWPKEWTDRQISSRTGRTRTRSSFLEYREDSPGMQVNSLRMIIDLRSNSETTLLLIAGFEIARKSSKPSQRNPWIFNSLKALLCHVLLSKGLSSIAFKLAPKQLYLQMWKREGVRRLATGRRGSDHRGWSAMASRFVI